MIFFETPQQKLEESLKKGHGHVLAAVALVFDHVGVHIGPVVAVVEQLRHAPWCPASLP